MLVYLFIVVAILTLATYIVTCIFGCWKNKILRKCILIGFALILTLGVTNGILRDANATRVEKLQEEYEALNLYYNTVNYSTNEYVRFDYYTRVTNFHERLTTERELSQSIWLKNLYPDEWDVTMNTIEFLLIGD